MDESHFKALKELARNGKISQRELSEKVGLSLGRVNYIVNSLIEKGYIKAKRFKNSKQKWAYRYVLTPRGLREKVRITRQFLQVKLREYERLHQEIENLKHEVVAEADETRDE